MNRDQILRGRNPNYEAIERMSRRMAEEIEQMILGTDPRYSSGIYDLGLINFGFITERDGLYTTVEVEITRMGDRYVAVRRQ
jgi:hypothetical protein